MNYKTKDVIYDLYSIKDGEKVDNSTKNLLGVTTAPGSTDWNALNWRKIEVYVDRLQKRIYQAASLKKYRKVRDSQKILANSNAALLLAIRKVTQINKGKSTPGMDRLIVLTNEERGELFDTMKLMNIKFHKPKPAYRKYIKKKNGKFRPLGIPTIIDRIYQEIIRIVLEPQAEANFEPISYGFRPKRSCHDAASRIIYNIRGEKMVMDI